MFLVRIFKSNQRSIIILMVFIGIALWVKSFVHPVSFDFFFDQHPMPLYALLQYLLGKGVAGNIFAVVMLVITGFLLIRLNTRFIFIQDRTHLPLFFFLLIAGGYSSLQRLNPALISSVFILFALERMLATYRIDKLSLNPFEASFLISIASLFYAPAAFFLVVIWISVALLRPGYWREWIYTILGFALPYLFLYSFYYLTAKDFEIESRKLFSFITNDFNVNLPSIPYRLFFGYTLLLLIVASVFMIRVYLAKKILARRIFNLMFWWFAIAVGVFFLLPSVSYEILVIASIPASYVLGHYFLYAKTRAWIQELLFALFVILVVYGVWMG